MLWKRKLLKTRSKIDQGDEDRPLTLDEALRLAPPPVEPEIPDGSLDNDRIEKAVRLDTERWKIHVDIWKGQIDVWKTSVAATQENLKHTAEYGRIAITNAVLINGAAALGLLTFLGNIYTKSSEPRLQVFALLQWPIVSFAAGVLLAGLGAGAMSVGLSNATLMKKKRALSWAYVGRALIVGSFLAFCIGVGFAYSALKALPKG